MIHIRSKPTQWHQLHKHETKRHVLLKFLLVLCIFLLYFIFIASRYGFSQGLFVTSLTWSFFVLCTPIADAGFLIDFPLRLVTGIRMFVAEVFVWGLAIGVNVYAYFFVSEIYEKTNLLSFFYHILESPFPYWAIILLSAVGTFVSIQFGDELIDNVYHKDRTMYVKHKKKYWYLVMLFIFVLSFVLYDFLLKKLGVNVPF